PSKLHRMPAVPAQVLHQADGALDQLCRPIDFFDRLAAVRVRDDHPVASGRSVAADLVPQLLAVLVEEPDHAPRVAHGFAEHYCAKVPPRCAVADARCCSLADARVVLFHTDANTAAPSRPARAFRMTRTGMLTRRSRSGP